MGVTHCGLTLILLLTVVQAGSVRRKRSSVPKFFGAAAKSRFQLNYFRPFGVPKNEWADRAAASQIGRNAGGSNGGNSGGNSGGNNGGNTGTPRTRSAACDMSPNPKFSGVGAIRGKIELTETEGQGITMAVSLTGFMISTHALTVRQTGKMVGGCEDAGGVYTPPGRTSTGGLGNVSVNSQGQVSVTLVSAGNSLFGDDSIVGRVISVSTADNSGFMSCCVVYRVD